LASCHKKEAGAGGNSGLKLCGYCAGALREPLLQVLDSPRGPGALQPLIHNISTARWPRANCSLV